MFKPFGAEIHNRFRWLIWVMIFLSHSSGEIGVYILWFLRFTFHATEAHHLRSTPYNSAHFMDIYFVDMYVPHWMGHGKIFLLNFILTDFGINDCAYYTTIHIIECGATVFKRLNLLSKLSIGIAIYWNHTADFCAFASYQLQIIWTNLH